MNFNKVILAGNLTRDPQLSYLPSQTPVVDFGLAINRKWKGSDGQKNEDTCFVDCRAFGKQAELVNQYFTKGKPILVEGRLDFQSWEKDGQRHSKHRVTVERFSFTDAPREQAQQRPAAATATTRPADEYGPGNVDDIPF